MSPRLFGFFLLVLPLLGGCSFRRPKVAPEQPSALRLGRIALINEEEKFALIETFGLNVPPVGRTLRVYRGAAVAAELRTTGVRRRPFLVADVMSGELEKGDVVFQPEAEGATPPRAEAAATPVATPPPRTRRQGWRRWVPFLKQPPAAHSERAAYSLGSEASALDQ